MSSNSFTSDLVLSHSCRIVLHTTSFKMATVGVDFDANSTLGALLCGMLVSCTLFGVLTVQCYNYNRYFPQDIRMIKFLVSRNRWSVFYCLLTLDHQVLAVWYSI